MKKPKAPAEPLTPESKADITEVMGDPPSPCLPDPAATWDVITRIHSITQAWHLTTDGNEQMLEIQAVLDGAGIKVGEVEA